MRTSAISTFNPVRPNILRLGLAMVLLAPAVELWGQAKDVQPLGSTPSPAGQTFHDTRYRLKMDIPSEWSLTLKDHQVSTFRLDARSATRSTRMRAVATITFNPYPDSTFSGAYVYFSVTPRSSDSACARQAGAPRSGRAGSSGLRSSPERAGTAEIGGQTFNEGRDQHGNICVQARDRIYTAYRNHACLRFDLAMNNFCGGEVSGVRDMSQQEMDDINRRMQNILSSARFERR